MMTHLVRQRPMAVWFLFLAGAVTGGIGSSLMEPQLLLAEPDNLNGRKFAELERMVAAHNELLEVISRDETGLHIADRVDIQCDADREGTPALTVCSMGGTAVKVTGDAGTDPLMAVVPFDVTGPTLHVEGPSLFKGTAGDDPLMTIMPLEHEQALRVEGSSFFKGTGGDDPVMAIMPLEHERALRVEGPSLFTGDVGTDPLMLIVPLDVTGPALSVAGIDRALCFHPDRVELLVECGDPEAEVFGAFGVDEVGSFLTVKDIVADTVEATTIVETGKPGPF